MVHGGGRRSPALATRWTDGAAAELAAESLDRSRLQAQLQCHRGSLRSVPRRAPRSTATGRAPARVRFDCDRGSLDVSLQLDEAGRLSAASFASPRDATCVP